MYFRVCKIQFFCVDFSLSRTFTISDFFAAPLGVRDSGCRLYLEDAKIFKENIYNYFKNLFTELLTTSICKLNIFQNLIFTQKGSINPDISN